ncbi:MAG: META domain-containing protein [Caldilineaceae bacterium]
MNNRSTSSVRLYRPLLTFLLMLGLTGCSPILPGNTLEPTAASTPSTGEANVLAGTQWQLTTLDVSGNVTPVASGSDVTLKFSNDGQATGNAGCNSYGGSYRVDNDSITFGDMVSTKMACTDSTLMTQEQQVLQALGSADLFEVRGDQLIIWYDNGSNRLNFTASSATSEPTAATPAPTVAQPTETVAASPTSAPTVTQVPTVASGDDTPSDVKRINFAPGATTAEINGNIAERDVDYYVLQAQQGQIMSVEITSPNGDVLLSVVGADGNPYKRYQNGPPSWTSTLPVTQDYYLHVVSVGPATSYTLRVWIEPLSNNSGPERVEFAAGATSASRSGALPEAGFKEYVLNAQAGQTLHVQTVGYGAPVEFTIRGPAGTSWPGESQGASAHVYATQVTLPNDGDYIVTLSLLPSAGATRYDVTFTIDGSTTVPVTPNPSEAERIEFDPGATSAQRSGLLPSGPGTLQYVLAAQAGQTMTVDATSDGTPLSMMIEDPTGNRRIPEMRQVTGGYAIGAQVVLPATGDYVVTLQKGDHTPSTNYSVTFTIQ